MLAFLLPAFALVQAEPKAATSLTPDTEARWVAFELTPYNQIRFALELNGHAAHAILDTGLSDTIVTAAFARTAGLIAYRRQRAAAIGGSVDVDWANLASLTFGGLARRGGRIGIAAASGERFGADAFLGSDILACCALEIDYDARRFRMLPSGRMPFAGTIVPLTRARASGVYQSEVRIGARRLRPIVVDTGDGAALTLSRAAWASVDYRGSPVTTTIGWGMGGASVTQIAVVPSVALPGLAPVESEVRVEGEGGFTARIGAAGRLGSGLLQRYRVLLDPGAGRMILQPGKTIAAPVIRSTSGLLLDFTAASLRVVHVMRGSPAALGGWRPGETICAAEGRDIADQVDRQGLVEWSVGTPGRTISLTLCHGTRRTLKLARFY
ncbi:aspartyl protease family protein [Sphingomonas sp. M1-B02]|uniref:aspartyl protease family protein n=1 Tax=Sphingomonas sp. M1-B02 TaxID=3114300 RepID=UPI00223FBE4D|nr:aspartyl protease family protein [Sphingomonas sp. S6-11]UZK65923.1 aspartyl protease family protein [Sphingomonas sp. S6-11]